MSSKTFLLLFIVVLTLYFTEAVKDWREKGLDKELQGSLGKNKFSKSHPYGGFNINIY